MFENRRSLAGLAVAGLLLAGCGTTLGNKAFDKPGSGKVLEVQGGNNGGAGVGATAAPSVGPSASASAGPSASTGTTGTNGTAGRTVTSGGGGGGQAVPSGCSNVKWTGPGVSGDTVKIGNIVSGQGNPFSPNQFIVSYYGAYSYFSYLNSQGGLCGKKVQFIKCDDNGDRNQDVACAHKLVDQDHVFAMVGNNPFQYSGAQYVSQSGTPDIGGEPITGSAYYTYPHLYAIIGSYYKNNGTAPSQYFGLAGVAQYFKNKLHMSKAGVIYYAQTDSHRGALYVITALKQIGVHVDEEQVPLAGDPSPQVQDMKNRGDQAIFDALDLAGNSRVCQAMQNYNYNPPKISTVSVWSQELGQSLGQYQCAKNYYAWGFSSNYADTSDPNVRLFQQAYNSFAAGAPISQWSMEGWIAGMWFADAVKSCGATVARACVEKFLNNGTTGYGAHGLMDAHTLVFQHWASPPATGLQCYTIAKWSGSSNGTWATDADQKHNCMTTHYFTYATG